MDQRVCKQVLPVAKKGKKNGKDEFDRVKQAEKKKRRLEKALATSAAIRAELEKKKEKRLEEQRRLDEQGASTAEAAALHVLLGEDSDDLSGVMMRQSCGSYAVQGIGLASNGYGLGSARDVWDNRIEISADLIASQVVSSLHIPENADRNAFISNRMFQGYD